jgi:AI-2 transport protein TqsA
MNDLKTTNRLLLIFVIPLVFYLLKTLDFIFIPLVAAMFIALVFLPLVRWLKSKGSPKWLNIIIVIILFLVGFRMLGFVIQISSKEILATNDQFLEEAKIKLAELINGVEAFFGVEFLQGEQTLQSLITRENLSKNLLPTASFVTGTVSMLLTMLFFVLLLLADSIDVEKLLNSTLLKGRFTSVKTFRKIEKDLVTFIKVKFGVSLLTGIGVGVACWGFGVSFPVFWGLFAFLINFVQMIGSVICVAVLSVFAFVDLSLGNGLLLFVLTITGIQVLVGGILEPIFMGRSFSINVITILIALMLWGFIWGIPGLIMSIPITVFFKVLMEQFDSTRPYAELMSGQKR